MTGEEVVVGIAGVGVDGGFDGAVSGVGLVAFRSGQPVAFAGVDIGDVCVEALPATEFVTVESCRRPRLVEVHLPDPGWSAVPVVAGLQLSEHQALRHVEIVDVSPCCADAGTGRRRRRK